MTSSQSLRAITLAAVFAVAGCATTPTEQSPEARAQAVIASPIRTDQDRRMDASRNPAQFLPFTGVKRGMVVLDVSAGAGYTSQLLALSIGPEGKVYAQRTQPGDALTKRLAENPQANFVPVYQSFEDPVPANAPRLDLVTIVNNYHDIVYLPVDRARMNQRLYAALKPGGRLVIVDHAAKPGTGTSAAKSLHRIDQAVVVADAHASGLRARRGGPVPAQRVRHARKLVGRRPGDDRQVRAALRQAELTQ